MSESTLLRALAALLIANSHLESYHPSRLFAIDGLMGDSLFFILSGYGLALSDARNPRSLIDWYGRRLARLLPPYLIVVFLAKYVAGAGWRSWAFADYFYAATGWHAPYYFVGQILSLYLFFFAAMKGAGPGRFRVLFLAPMALYPAIVALGRSPELFHLYHWLYYSQAMLFGGWLARRPGGPGVGSRSTGAELIGLLLAYFAVRLTLARGGLADWFFLPHLLVFPIVVRLMRVCRPEGSVGRLAGSARARWVVGLLGGSTLEIFLIHFVLIPNRRIAGLAWPLNVAALLLGTTALACLLSQAIRRAPELPKLISAFSGLVARGDEAQGGQATAPAASVSTNAAAPSAPRGPLIRVDQAPA